MKNHFHILYILLAALLLAACGSDDDVVGYKPSASNQDDDNTTSVINDSYTYKLRLSFMSFILTTTTPCVPWPADSRRF